MFKTVAILISVLILFSSVSLVHAEDKDAVKRAIMQMNIDDLNEIREKLDEVANESARKTGYVKGQRVGGGGGFYYFIPSSAINDNRPARGKKISSMLGGAGGFLVNVNPNLAIGGLFGGLGGYSEKFSNITNSYWSYSVGAGFQMLHAQFKPIINDSFIIGLDLGLGRAQGGLAIYDTDERLNGTDMYREGECLAYLLGLDIRKRINYTWHTGLKVGYFGAKIDELKRAGVRDPGLNSLDLSSMYVALCMGGNF